MIWKSDFKPKFFILCGIVEQAITSDKEAPYGQLLSREERYMEGIKAYVKNILDPNNRHLYKQDSSWLAM